MAKLLEKNGAEMMASIAAIAVPIRKFIEDEEFDKAWKQATKKGVDLGLTDILKIYADLAPLMLGEKHLKDTLAIVAEVEGKPLRELLAMNGTELMADILKAWGEQIKPFFMQLGLSVGVK